jgi:UDP-N-acetylmuramoylalanine--D-glutamate ligase
MKGLFIFGFGVTGKGVLKFCQERGIKAFIYDDRKENVPSEFFTDYTNFDFTLVDFVILTPGISLSHELILKAKSVGIETISDLELFKKFAPQGLKIIGITGSNGKSTTVSLLTHILKNLGKKVFLSGNIGISPLTTEAFESEYCVMEVSSYQLEITDFTFDASAILNITPDHIEHHGSFENYKNAKAKILQNSPFSLTSADCQEASGVNSTTQFSVKKILQNGFSLVKNKFYENGVLVAPIPEFENLKGEHNLENILCCLAITFKFCNLELSSILTAIQSFKGLPHRIEFVSEVEGVKFINDSKATNANSTLTALKTFQKNNVFLIAGGRQKEEGIEALLELKEFNCVQEVLLIGEASGNFAKQIIEHNKKFPDRYLRYSIAGTLEKAVHSAFISAKKGKNNVVLLSPLCASFDQFKNFEERGVSFKNYVSRLKK